MLDNYHSKLSYLINSFSDVIIELSDQGIVSYINPNCQNMFGILPEELLGINLIKSISERQKDIKFLENIHPDDLNGNFNKFLEQCIYNERELQIRYKTKEGEFIWIEIRGKKILDYNNRTKILLICRDITEKKDSEIKKLEKLKDISNLKTELMRKFSHELKTPLLTISGFSELLLTLHSHNLNNDVVSIIDEIKKGCERLNGLIKDILESSKLESDKIKLNLKVQDLTPLIKICVNEIKLLLERKNQKIILEIPNNLITKFDKNRIYEVLNNLLMNSIKYSHPNTKVIIKACIKEESIIISITDQGSGFSRIEKDLLFKKFERFERHNSEGNVINEGNGLGLYIIKTNIDLHNGKIWMESRGISKGSTFYFSLPLINA